MPSVQASVIARGGVAATFELYEVGHSRPALAAAVRAGQVLRARQGWYVHPDLHPEIIAAVRVGGYLSCVPALRLHGGWVPEHCGLHVALAPNACRPRSARDSRVRLEASGETVTLHWRAKADGIRGIAPTDTAISDAVRCQPPDIVAAAVSVLLHNDRNLRLGECVPRWLHELDGVCESGSEALWWFRMRRLQLHIRRQVHIGGVGRIDFLVGTRLVVEVDGAQYHTDPVAFHRDRRRDAVLSRLGFRVLRFSYRQVVDHWDEVEAAVLAAVVRGDSQ